MPGPGRFLENKLYKLIKQVGSILLDSVFLVLWVLLQAGVNAIVTSLQDQLSVVGYLVISTVQLIFAIATLIPVIANFVEDTAVIYYDMRDAIRSRAKQSKSYDNQ